MIIAEPPTTQAAPQYGDAAPASNPMCSSTEAFPTRGQPCGGKRPDQRLAVCAELVIQVDRKNKKYWRQKKKIHASHLELWLQPTTIAIEMTSIEPLLTTAASKSDCYRANSAETAFTPRSPCPLHAFPPRQPPTLIDRRTIKFV